MAQSQLGTVGGGNHYVDLFVDEQDRVWVGCHFGSRGLGHKTATWFLKANGAKDAIFSPPLVLGTDTDVGRAYIECMTLAGAYARAGRDWVCAEVARILGASIVEVVHNHHNFAWREEHGGESLWVVRKGATPSHPGQRSFIGSTMGEPSVIVEGVEHADQAPSFRSTVHGAGRAKGRKAAKREFKREDMDAWVRAAGVELRGGDLDESPMAYKRLERVLQHHPSVRVLHTLKPIGVAMAGRAVSDADPYKD
jgi:tRNA-splicing ligase RtcB